MGLAEAGEISPNLAFVAGKVTMFHLIVYRALCLGNEISQDQVGYLNPFIESWLHIDEVMGL